MSKALVPSRDTSITLTGNYEADLETGAKIRDAAESLQFMLGDWVLEMQEKHEESQRTLAHDMSVVTGVAAETLRSYAKVSKSFPVGRRLPEASWSHHQAVTGATAPTDTLQSAIQQGLSLRDTRRLAKGLPVGGEDTARKESSTTVEGASMEEAALEAIANAERYLSTALATLNKPGFRLTVPVGQSLMARLESVAKPFVGLEEAIKAEVGAYL